MSEDGGIDYPVSIKMTANTGHRYTETGKVIHTPIKDFIRLTDREQQHAYKLLTWFTENQEALKQQQKEGNSKGWSLIRELSHIHQGVDITNDPIIADSVIVKKAYDVKTDELIQKIFYYISSKKDRDGIPLVYMLREAPPDRSILKSDVIQLVNALHVDPQKRAKMLSEIFSCTFGNGLAQRSEFEVWKEGKSLREPKTDKSKPGGLRQLTPAPLPQRI